jgi:hypothetical protein
MLAALLGASATLATKTAWFAHMFSRLGVTGHGQALERQAQQLELTLLLVEARQQALRASVEPMEDILLSGRLEGPGATPSQALELLEADNVELREFLREAQDTCDVHNDQASGLLVSRLAEEADIRIVELGRLRRA